MNDLYDDEDFLREEDYEEIDSQSRQGKSSFQKGKEAGENIADKVQKYKDGTYKNRINNVKDGISDIKSGNIKEGVNKIAQNPAEKVSKSVEKAKDLGNNAKKGLNKARDITNKVGEKGASTVRKGADALKTGANIADKSSQAVKEGAKGAKEVATAVGAAADAANVVGGVADIAGGAGASVNAAATTVKAGTEIAKAVAGATEAVAGVSEASAKTTKAAAQGVKTAAGASEQAFKSMDISNKIGDKFGDLAKNTTNALNNAKDKAKEIKNKIEQTGNDAKDIIKPFKATADILKKLPKIIIIASLACSVLVYITFLYNNKLSSIIETTDQFNKYASDTENYFKGLSSSMYTGLKGESNSNKKFYEELKKWYDKSNGQLDLPLVFSALYYPDIKNSDMKSDYSEDEISDNQNQNTTTNDSENKDIDDMTEAEANKYNKGKIKRLRKLCKNMLDSSNNLVSTEEYKEYLKKYIKKEKEYRKFIGDVSGDEKDNIINSIINEIYQYRSWYVGVYGEYGLAAADSENYDDTCQGAIDKNLVNDLKVPVDSKKGSFSFDNTNSYGLYNGIVHNGVDLDNNSAGVSNGDSVYSIHDGTVESVGNDESVGTAGATDATSEDEENVDVNTACKDACSNNVNASSNSTAVDSCKKSCVNSCKSKKDIKSCANGFKTKDSNDSDDSEIGGTWIKIKHTDIAVSGNKYTFYSVYRNLDTNSVTLKQGDAVKKGDVIGKIGTTTSGVSQLHFEFRNDKDEAIDPTNLFVKCVSNGSLVGSTNEEMVWNHFTGAGYSKATTAAAMGNIMSESGFYPDRVQGDIPRSNYSVDYTAKVNSGAITEHDFVYNGPGGGGYGLAQWTSSDRKQILYDRTKKSGLNIDDLKTQLDYEEEELRGSGWNGNDSLKAQWESATEATLKAAALAYCNGFERAASEYCNSVRENNAQTIYDKYKNYVTPKITAGSGGTTNTSAAGDGYNATYTSSRGITYKEYLQWAGSHANDYYPYSGTIAHSGCGPTSVAVILSGLVDPSITPTEPASYMATMCEAPQDHLCTGPNNISAALQKYGLSTEKILSSNDQNITSTLNSGKVIVISVDSRTRFTSGGHLMAIVDINSSGQVYVINPNASDENPNGWYDLSEITKGSSYMVATPEVKVSNRQ